LKKLKFIFGIVTVFLGIASGVAALTYPEYANNIPEQVFGIFLYVILLVGGLYFVAESFRE